MNALYLSPFHSQLEFGFPKYKEPDRNYHKGGRSFYFFDLDDNVFFLATHIYLFHKKTKKEISVSTGEFAQINSHIGKSGNYIDYELNFCPETGSFRRFRDWSESRLKMLSQKSQPFLEDIAEALGKPDFFWKGPSWVFFFHAVFNHRPISLITSRGHSPHTLINGFEELRKKGHLPYSPNYLGLYPLSHPEIRSQLGDHNFTDSIPVLKKKAIIASVESAMENYGKNVNHRFGMSEDDEKNIELIIEAMKELKLKYPENSFYVIDARTDVLMKEEVFIDHVTKTPVNAEQLQLIC